MCQLPSFLLSLFLHLEGASLSLLSPGGERTGRSLRAGRRVEERRSGVSEERKKERKKERKTERQDNTVLLFFLLRYFTQTGGITPLGVFSDTFPGHKMRVYTL
jgi:hypothetical protein